MITVDAHSDFGIKVFYDHINGKQNSLRDIHLPQLKKGGIDIECLVMGGDFDFYPQINSRLRENILKTIKVNTKQIKENEKEFFLIKSKKDLNKLNSMNKIGFILALEGAGSIGNDLSVLSNYYESGIRLISLTHNGKNTIGDGIGVKNAKGLTDFGKKAVMKMNELGIIIDLSHSSIPLFWNAIELIDGPCIASHSNSRALCSHVRNLNDDQIATIGSKNGVIGINLYGGFIDAQRDHASLERLIDHIDFIREKIGINHIGIGADLLNFAVDDGIVLVDTSSEESSHAPANMSFPIKETIPNVSYFFKIFELLEKRGYNKKEIKKIAGENFVRVFKLILN